MIRSSFLVCDDFRRGLKSKGPGNCGDLMEANCGRGYFTCGYHWRYPGALSVLFKASSSVSVSFDRGINDNVH